MQHRALVRTWIVVISLMAILGTFAARCFDAARASSVTCDESIYLSASLHIWITGDDLGMWRLGVPRLPHLINSSVIYLVLRQAGALPAPSTNMILRLANGDLLRMVPLAREVAIGWGILTLLGVYWAVARSWGAVLGLVAAALLSMVPEMLAHASLATSDMPCAATMLIALLTLARYAERPSRSRWLAAALAIGLAWATRHTAALLLPLAVGVHLWVAFRQPRPSDGLAIAKRLAGTACSSVGLVILAFMVLWATDGLRTIPLGSIAHRSTTLGTIRNSLPLDIWRLPIPTSLESLRLQLGHVKYGHSGYFCGEVGLGGWMRYFPVAFLLKTPIGLLILVILALVRVRPRGALDWILLGCLALLWSSLMRSKVDSGLRYALATYPLIMPFIARLFEPSKLRDRIWGPITIAATVFLVWESASCHPRYLSSFNLLGGGPRMGWLYLADSNVDWRQDFDALAAELKELGIEEITNAVWATSPADALPGIRLMSVGDTIHKDRVEVSTPPRRRLYYADGTYRTIPTRYVALSVNSMVGLYNIGNARWFWTRRLVKRVNDSIFIFDMDQPAETPFFR